MPYGYEDTCLSGFAAGGFRLMEMNGCPGVFGFFAEEK